jgi:hypothetical protein
MKRMNVKPVAVWPVLGLVAGLLVVSSCGFGSKAQFTLSSATVDANHSCASGASNAPYDIRATVDGHNSTSSAVSIKTIAAVMTLAAVHGGWLQTVGYKYVTTNLVFAPNSVGAGSTATLNVTIPSACTNLSKSPGSVSYGDYSVTFMATTSAGTFTIESRNRHRIIAI